MSRFLALRVGESPIYALCRIEKINAYLCMSVHPCWFRKPTFGNSGLCFLPTIPATKNVNGLMSS
jgi:hypothetical protein